MRVEYLLCHALLLGCFELGGMWMTAWVGGMFFSFINIKYVFIWMVATAVWNVVRGEEYDA